MPRKTIRKSTLKTQKPFLASSEDYLSKIKWGESYTSLFLGAVVVVVALVLLFSFLKAKNLIKNTDSTSTSNMQNEQTSKNYPKTYTVKEGENLWAVSEKIYGSGYNWVDLAKANNLSNPNVLFVGAKLTVPNVPPKQVTMQQETLMTPISGVYYTVAKGDNLWEIAVRAYGDGYKWSEIAKANNLSNPDLIYPGNRFSIPRK